MPGDSKRKSARLMGCGMKSMQPIFKTEMLIYQAKANLDVIKKLGVVKLGKCWLGVGVGTRSPIPFWSIIYLILRFKFNTIVSFGSGI